MGEERRNQGKSRGVTFHDGVGIEKDQQEKVWQRFYQVDPSRSGGSGAGLGLAMVRKIAQTHGGRVELESVPGLHRSEIPTKFLETKRRRMLTLANKQPL